MIDRDYLARQAATLMRMSQSAKDPRVVAALAVKAADLQARRDEAPLVPAAPQHTTDKRQKPSGG